MKYAVIVFLVAVVCAVGLAKPEDRAGATGSRQDNPVTPAISLVNATATGIKPLAECLQKALGDLQAATGGLLNATASKPVSDCVNNYLEVTGTAIEDLGNGAGLGPLGDTVNVLLAKIYTLATSPLNALGLATLIVFVNALLAIIGSNA